MVKVIGMWSEGRKSYLLIGFLFLDGPVKDVAVFLDVLGQVDLSSLVR